MKIAALNKKLQILITQCQSTILKREKYFDWRGEAWQESEAGEFYQEETEALIDALSLLQEARDDYFYENAN